MEHLHLWCNWKLSGPWWHTQWSIMKNSSNLILKVHLHRNLEEEIYMVQAPEYRDGLQQVYKLIWALYGLKQAENVWNTKLNEALTELRFRQLKSDYCCYIREDEEDSTLLLVWVNDFLSISNRDLLNKKLNFKNILKSNSLGSHPSLLESKSTKETT